MIWQSQRDFNWNHLEVWLDGTENIRKVVESEDDKSKTPGTRRLTHFPFPQVSKNADKVLNKWEAIKLIGLRS